MAKDPAFLFYPGDYLRDTQCLSEKSQVAYDRIMCEHMRNICISQQQLNFFIKRLTDDEKSEVMQLLKKIPGGFQIEWVAESICKRRDYSKSRAENRKGKSKNISSTYDSHMENENENTNEDVNKDFGKSENLLNLDLPEIKIGAAVEYLAITKNVKATREMVLILWATFKEKHQEEKYASKSKAYKHFFDSLKFEQINGTHQQFNPGGGKLGTSAARIEAARKF